MPENQKSIHDALVQVCGLEKLKPGDYQTCRLGGLTNLVYRVELADQKLIVRIAGKGTNEFIDRHVELHNARAAQAANISAPVIWADPDSGVIISQCIDNTVTLTPKKFKSQKGAVERVGKCLSLLHNSGVKFRTRFDPFAVVENYHFILTSKNVPLPAGFARCISDMVPIRNSLEQMQMALVPCHCDPLSENFLDDGSRVWLVDWEYSGMNDPMWDLGDLSVEAEFDREQEQALLKAYFVETPDELEIARMVIYKALCDLLWALWGLIQHANGADVEDFYVYAITRFERCQSLMQSDTFQIHCDVLKNS